MEEGQVNPNIRLGDYINLKMEDGAWPLSE